MSLLLDALKKAAEKNANKKDVAQNNHDTHDVVNDSDVTESVDPKTVESKLFSGSENNELQDVAQEPKPVKKDEITTSADGLDLQQKINIENDASVAESQEIGSIAEQENPSQSVLEIRENETEASFLEDLEDRIEGVLFDEDPSLKLALSDEEIVLTDDDVTEFLGGDQVDFDDGGLSLQDRSELDLPQKTNVTNLSSSDKTTTQSLNLEGVPHDDGTISQSLSDSTSTTTGGLGLGQTTNLNSLTNESTVTVQDSTTKTFGTDNYDRTLVKLEEDVSKVFTGMKSENSNSAMTPDFAKKVFVSKSTSLRRRNYKWYALISLVVLIAIAVFALFEMQYQIDDIDSGLARLKRNPVPTKLRFEQPKKQDSLAVLDGKVDTEALALLKSMEQASKNVQQTNISETQEKEPVVTPKASVDNQDEVPSEVEIIASEQERVTGQEQAVPEKSEKSEETQISKVKRQLIINQPVTKKTRNSEEKAAISIQSQVKEKPESALLRSAYEFYEQGDYDKAQKNYDDVLALDATNRDALLGQAAIYSSQDQTSMAIENYQKLLQENPKDTLAMTSLIAASNLSPVESESSLKLMQRESPNASYLQFAIGNVLSAQNRWQESQQYYFDAYQSDPSNADYAYNLAVSMEQIGKPDIAIGFYQKALENAEIKPGSFDEITTQQRIEVLSQ